MCKMIFEIGQSVYVKFNNREEYNAVEDGRAVSRYKVHTAWHNARVTDQTRVFVSVQIKGVGYFTFRKNPAAKDVLTEKKPHPIFNAQLHLITPESTRKFQQWKKEKDDMEKELAQNAPKGEKGKLQSDFNALAKMWRRAGGNGDGINMTQTGRNYSIIARRGDRERVVFTGTLKQTRTFIERLDETLDCLASQNIDNS